MSADDRTKVEDALEAIRSLVEASGLDTSGDDGVIHLDSIVWRGTPNHESEVAANGDIALQMLEHTTEPGYEPISNRSWVDEFSADTQIFQSAAADTGVEPIIAPVMPQENPVEQANNLSDRTDNFDKSFGDYNGQHFSHNDVMMSFHNKDESLFDRSEKAASDIQETRELLAEFQSLLNSTIALRNIQQAQSAEATFKEAAAPTTQDAVTLNNQDANADFLEPTRPAVNDTTSPAIEPTTSDAKNQNSAVVSSQTNAPEASQPVKEPEAAVHDLSAASLEAANTRLSKIALHLVDVAETSDTETKSLFTSAVRSTMQEIIRGQMTDWLSANMTDIIEDALRDEMRPAKPNNPKSTVRQDRNN